MLLKNLPPTAREQLLAEVYVEAKRRIQHTQLFDPDPVRWIETHFYIPETNAAIQLEPYQAAVIREALRKAGDQFVYSLILYSDIKKSAKSTIAAAISLYLAWHNAWESVRIVGNDLRQADSRTFYYIRRAIELNPRLHPMCDIKMYHIGLFNKSFIQAIPVDPKGEAGGGDLVTCFTELWAAKNEAAQRLWSETTLSPLKFGKSLRWAESYAGFLGSSPILEQLYETGVKEGTLISAGIEGLELYANPAARMLTLWNTTPRCHWQTEEYYQQEAAVLTPSEFDRMHRNQWATSTESFVPPEWWDACGRTPPPPLDPNEPVILAMDAGVTSDCFAIVMVGRRGDSVQVYYPRAWKPDGKALDYRPIEAEVRRLINTYNVIELTYDPFQLHDMATRIRAEESVNVRPFNQATPRAIADKLLFDLIRDRRVQHNNEPDLREHVINANRKPEDDKLRIIKRDANMKIDLCVALSMAASRTFAYASDE